MKIVATSLMLLFFLMQPGLSTGGPGLRQADIQDLLDEAEALLKRRQFEKALKLYKQANKKLGGACAPCLLGLSKTFTNMGAFKNAYKEAEKLVESTDDLGYKVHGYNQIGIARLSLGKEKDLLVAEDAFKKVLLLSEGESNMSHFNLAHVLFRLERNDEAAEQLKEFLLWEDTGPTAERAIAMLEDPRRATEPFAPDFSVVTLEGEYLASEDLAGKVILLDFWATWCGPCKAALPGLRRLSKKMDKDPFVMISVSTEERDTIEAFVEKERMDWPQCRDERGKLGRGLFEVTVLPTYIVIDHEGIIQFHTTGWSPSKDRQLGGKVSRAIKKAKKAAEQ